jgi:hypothetical protein
MIPTTTVIDLTPKALADALDALVGATRETDREVAAVLTLCREGLRNLAWNRYAQAQTRGRRAYRVRRRHQSRQEGCSDA